MCFNRVEEQNNCTFYKLNEQLKSDLSQMLPNNIWEF